MGKTIDIKANGRAEETIALNPNEISEDRHTEDIQEIITKVPSWILRWGITLFFGILLMVIGISAFIKYPDTIKGNLKIESNSLATPVISNLSGKITKVFITKDVIVKKGQPLIIIQDSDDALSYTLNATQDGKISFAAIVQPGNFLKANQEVFVIHPQNEQFFGTMEIPSGSISKIKEGQEVLINLREYNIAENGQLKGKISYIADEPIKGFFTLKVTFNNYSKSKDAMELKSWMNADAEIITKDATILSRISRNMFRSVL